jgi:hypothetical protein
MYEPLNLNKQFFLNKINVGENDNVIYLIFF